MGRQRRKIKKKRRFDGRTLFTKEEEAEGEAPGCLFTRKGRRDGRPPSKVGKSQSENTRQTKLVTSPCGSGSREERNVKNHSKLSPLSSKLCEQFSVLGFSFFNSFFPWRGIPSQILLTLSPSSSRVLLSAWEGGGKCWRRLEKARKNT